jgi:hypothetical protein
MAIKVITKSNAAGRQLETAIRLDFESVDDVSVCVLLHSSWSILKDLLKHKKLESTRDWMAKEYAKQSGDDPAKFYTLAAQDWNFFKHAKCDPTKAIHFNNEYLHKALMYAIHDFSQISQPSIIMGIHQYWCCAKHLLPDDVPVTAEYLAFIKEANKLFPDLHIKNEREQRLLGLEALQKSLEELMAKSTKKMISH